MLERGDAVTWAGRSYVVAGVTESGDRAFIVDRDLWQGGAMIAGQTRIVPLRELESETWPLL